MKLFIKADVRDKTNPVVYKEFIGNIVFSKNIKKNTRIIKKLRLFDPLIGKFRTQQVWIEVEDINKKLNIAFINVGL